MKVFAKNTSNATQSILFDIVENILRKGENAGAQHFSFSHHVFKSLLPNVYFRKPLRVGLS